MQTQIHPQNEDIPPNSSWVSVAFTFRASARAFPPSEPMLFSEHGADYQPNRTTKCKHKSIHKMKTYSSNPKRLALHSPSEPRPEPFLPHLLFDYLNII